MKKIRVLVVDDSIFFRNFIVKEMGKYPDIEVIGTAGDATEASEKISEKNPDVVTLDVEMPGMSGIDFLKKVMPEHPVPVVLVSSLNIKVFDALSAGAVDFVRKTDIQQSANVDRFLSELHTAIETASVANVRACRRPSTARTAPAHASSASASAASLGASSGAPGHAQHAGPCPLIAIGASTGGTETTLEILKDLPANMPGILVVQHMPPGFTKMYADRLNRLCAMEVREAKTGDRVRRGLVLIAPGDAHMRVVSLGNGEYGVQCMQGEKISGHCPSVDALFHSVAKNVGAPAVGVILTGMGQDGAAGLLAMRKAGSYTIGQDEASCVVYGMPMMAYKMGAVVKQASCDSIAGILKIYVTGRRSL